MPDRNIVRQGGKVYYYVKVLITYTSLHFDSSIRYNNHQTLCKLHDLVAIQCYNVCISDFHNQRDNINTGWKRKYSDRLTKHFSISMKPTLLSAPMNG